MYEADHAWRQALRQVTVADLLADADRAQGGHLRDTLRGWLTTPTP